MLDLPEVASRVTRTPLRIARETREVILAGSRIGCRVALEPIGTNRMPRRGIDHLERIAVVSIIGTAVSRSCSLNGQADD